MHAVRQIICSEALTVHNCWATLVILTLGDPHLPKGAQGRQDGAADPDTVLALRRCDDLNLHGRGCQSCEFLGHAFADAREHGGATGEDNVGIEVLMRGERLVWTPHTPAREIVLKQLN